MYQPYQLPGGVIRSRRRPALAYFITAVVLLGGAVVALSHYRASIFPAESKYIGGAGNEGKSQEAYRITSSASLDASDAAIDDALIHLGNSVEHVSQAVNEIKKIRSRIRQLARDPELTFKPVERRYVDSAGTACETAYRKNLAALEEMAQSQRVLSQSKPQTTRR